MRRWKVTCAGCCGDDSNIAHIAGHEVTAAEVEQVVYLDDNAVAFADDGHRRGRLLVLGSTRRGRLLFVALDAPASTGERYVVTARSMTAKERGLYGEEG